MASLKVQQRLSFSFASSQVMVTLPYRLTGSHSAVLWDSAEEEDCSATQLAPASHHSDADHLPNNSFSSRQQAASDVPQPLQTAGHEQDNADPSVGAVQPQLAQAGTVPAQGNSRADDASIALRDDSARQIRQRGLLLQHRHAGDQQQQLQEQQHSQDCDLQQQQQQQQQQGQKQQAQKQQALQQPLVLPQQLSSDAYHVHSMTQHARRPSSSWLPASHPQHQMGAECTVCAESRPKHAQHGAAAGYESQQPASRSAAAIRAKHAQHAQQGPAAPGFLATFRVKASFSQPVPQPHHSRDASRSCDTAAARPALLSSTEGPEAQHHSHTQQQAQVSEDCLSNNVQHSRVRHSFAPHSDMEAQDVVSARELQISGSAQQAQQHSVQGRLAAAVPRARQSAPAETNMPPGNATISHHSTLSSQQAAEQTQTAPAMRQALGAPGRDTPRGSRPSSTRLQASAATPQSSMQPHDEPGHSMPALLASCASPPSQALPAPSSASKHASITSRQYSVNPHLSRSNSSVSQGSCGSTARAGGIDGSTVRHSAHAIGTSSSHVVHAARADSAQMHPGSPHDGQSAVHARSVSAQSSQQGSATSQRLHARSLQTSQQGSGSEPGQASTDSQITSASGAQVKHSATALRQVQALVFAPGLGLRDEGSSSTLLSREGLEQDNTRLRHALSAIEQQLGMLRHGVEQQQVSLT